MIYELISDVLSKIGHMWKLNTGYIQPDEDDVRKLLDEAATKLYDGEPGDRLEAGGLIIEKDRDGYDVYVYVGRYK